MTSTHGYARSLVRSLARSFVRSFVRRSLVRSFVYFCFVSLSLRCHFITSLHCPLDRTGMRCLTDTNHRDQFSSQPICSPREQPTHFGIHQLPNKCRILYRWQFLQRGGGKSSDASDGLV